MFFRFFFLYQQSRESNLMLAIGTSVTIFALAGLCWCTRNLENFSLMFAMGRSVTIFALAGLCWCTRNVVFLV